MLEYYLQIIESFKEHQISFFLRTIREKIIDFLESDHFANQAKEFFSDIAGCRLMLMPSTLNVESFNPQIKAAYIFTTDNKLYYFNRTLKEPLIELPISGENYAQLRNTLVIKPVDGEAPKIITHALSQAQLDIISSYSGHEHMANCRLFLMPSVPRITDFDEYTHKAYIFTEDNKLYYFNRALPTVISEIPIAQKDYEALKTNFDLTSLEENQSYREIVHALSPIQLSIISKYSGHQYKEDDPTPPFTNFTHEPKQVVQFKEVINTLYHAELAFRDLENINLRDGKNRLLDIGTLYYHTIEHGYQASYLLTHLDLNTQQIFSQEIGFILKLLAKLQKHAENYGTQASTKIAEIVEAYPLSYTAGNIAGIAVDQMQPYTGNIDYNFLAQFSAVLPRYIEQLTEYIHKYTNKITNLEPTLDKQKINELEDNAIKLLQAINDAQSNTFLFTFKGISYLHIIQHVTTLSLSTLEQMGHMSEATQDVICDNLNTLKYDLLIELFAVVDKIEDEALLTPGTLSNPLMQVVIPFYQKIIQYASKPVDFANKGKELLTLEDQKFINLRIDKIRQRINTVEKQLFKSQEIQNTFNAFFNSLDNHKEFKRIIDLPEAIKKELRTHYIYIQPYFEKIDVDLHNEILRGLQNETGKRYDQLRNLYFQLRGHTTDHLEKIINLKPKLCDSLKSDIATYKFHIKFNKHLINSIQAHADLTLCPIELTDNDVKSAKSVNFLTEIDREQPSQLVINVNNHIPNLSAPAAANPQKSQTSSVINDLQKIDSIQLLDFNEKSVLNLEPNLEIDLGVKVEGSATVITKHDQLTAEQALDLLQYYQTQKTKIIAANKNFALFLDALQDGKNLIDKENKKELSHWYVKFQPYLLRIFLPGGIFNIRQLDKLITLNLNSDRDKISTPMIGINKKHFNHLYQPFNEKMAAAIEFCSKRIALYQELSKKKFKDETEKKILQPNYTYGNRAHYLIKHTHYSEAVSQFRQAIFNLTELLAEPLRAELKIAKSGVPFPELESQDKLWAQSKQVLSIKQIYNSLYHLEHICLQLEALDNKSYQTTYVRHLVEAYNHIDEIYKTVKDLYGDPYLTLIAQDIISKASKIQQEFLSQSEAYSVDPESVTDVEGHVKQNSIWYTLQAFMLIPAHIKALSNQQTMSPEELEKTQNRTKEITLNIERIIVKSDSYFKLLLETPTMYRLFTELKQKLAEFTTTTHHVVVDNIREINTLHFTNILIETDKWEDRLGLQPGLLSGPMKEILDEFYRGLVEPLGFTSDNYFDLITDVTPFIKRKEACKKVSADAQSQMNKNSFYNNYEVLGELSQSIDHYNNFTTGLLPPNDPLITTHIKNKILDDNLKVKAFIKEQVSSDVLNDNQQLLNKLSECVDIINVAELIKLLYTYRVALHKKKKYFSPSDKLSEQEHGSIENTVEFQQQITQLEQQIIDHFRATTENLIAPRQLIYTLSPSCTDKDILQLNPDTLWPVLFKQLPAIKTVYSYYQGIYSTYKVTVEIAQKKDEYIEKLIADQTILNEKIKQDYIQAEIKKRIDIVINQQTDLINLNGEYNSALEKDLLNKEFQAKLSKEVYNETDIKLAIKVKLLERAQKFKVANLDKYARLDYVLTATTDLQLYLRKSKVACKRGTSIFEDNETLRIKKTQVNIILDLAQKKRPNESVEERFTKIQKYVDTGVFRASMLTYRRFEHVSFNWLINCFLSLLQSLHLYKPTSLKCFEEINDAVSEKPKCLPRYGFFTESAREQQRYNLPFRFNLGADNKSPSDLELTESLPVPPLAT